MEVIIYKNTNGGVSVIWPNVSLAMSVDDVAKKDVPTGLAYKIIDSSELPSREYRTAWDVDESYLTSGVGE